MRTTVEIPDAIRARLLEIAAQRGEKGFSRIVEEALVRYLEAEAARVDTIEAAIATLGSLSEAEAEAMRDDIRELRATWR
jgi:predicted transcriptional regulator